MEEGKSLTNLMKWIWILLGLVEAGLFSISFLEWIPSSIFWWSNLVILSIFIIYFLVKYIIQRSRNPGNKFDLPQIFQDINRQLESMPNASRLRWDTREIRHQERKFKIDNKYVSYVAIFAPLGDSLLFSRVIYNLDEKKIVSIDGRLSSDVFEEDPFVGFSPTKEYSEPRYSYDWYPRHPYSTYRSRRPAYKPNFESDDYEFMPANNNGGQDEHE